MQVAQSPTKHYPNDESLIITSAAEIIDELSRVMRATGILLFFHFSLSIIILLLKTISNK